MEKNRRVKAVISLDAVEANFREMRKNIAEDTKMIAVIKADAYGHGAVQIARLIHDYDYIWGFAAATAEEAIHLRQAGITKPILILGIVFDEYYPELVQYEIRPAVCEYEEAKKLSGEAVRQGKTVHIHLALDTGMTRIGFADVPENVEVIRKIAELPNLEIEGMFTHFARADEYDRSPAMVQLDRYLKFEKLGGCRCEDSVLPLLQQCRYHPDTGGKSEHCTCRYHNLWNLSFRRSGKGYCKNVSCHGAEKSCHLCEGCCCGDCDQLWRHFRG